LLNLHHRRYGQSTIFFGMLSDGDFIKREQGQVPSLFNAFIFFFATAIIENILF
jgi:hypothetical protein